MLTPPWTLQDANKCMAQSETASFAKAAEYSLLRLWFPDTPSLHGEEIPLMPFQEGCHCCSSFWCLSSEHEKSEDCCIILLLLSLFLKRYWPKILPLNWLNLTSCNRNQTLCCTIHVAKRVLSATALLPSKRQKPQTKRHLSVTHLCCIELKGVVSTSLDVHPVFPCVYPDLGPLPWGELWLIGASEMQTCINLWERN